MNERERLQREIEALRAKNQSLEADKRSLGNQIKSLATANDSLSKNVKSLVSTNDSLVRDAKSLSVSKDQLEQKCQDLREALTKKQDELDALIRRIFGRQSERFEDDDQLKYEFASQAEIDDARERASSKRSKRTSERVKRTGHRSDVAEKSVFQNLCRAAK
jgi:FtsZ-binding cell division protein ZapB